MVAAFKEIADSQINTFCSCLVKLRPVAEVELKKFDRSVCEFLLQCHEIFADASALVASVTMSTKSDETQLIAYRAIHSLAAVILILQRFCFCGLNIV